jgi:uncharacterized protein YuzE
MKPTTPMKIQYFSETDTLAIELTTKPVAITNTITDDLILDYDNEGKLVAITLDNYSQNVEIFDLQALGVPRLAHNTPSYCDTTHLKDCTEGEAHGQRHQRSAPSRD